MSGGHLAIGLILSLVLFGGLVDSGAALPVAVVASIAVMLTAIEVSTVRVGVGAGWLTVGGATRLLARRISVAQVQSAEIVQVEGWTVFGIGRPWARRMTRMTVCAGPALMLALDTGEWLALSVRDPEGILELLPPVAPVSTAAARPNLRRPHSPAKETPMTSDPNRRPWFGPKRIGYGLRPQTWQGWLLTLAVVVAIIVIATLVK